MIVAPCAGRCLNVCHSDDTPLGTFGTSLPTLLPTSEAGEYTCTHLGINVGWCAAGSCGQPGLRPGSKLSLSSPLSGCLLWGLVAHGGLARALRCGPKVCRTLTPKRFVVYARSSLCVVTKRAWVSGRGAYLFCCLGLGCALALKHWGSDSPSQMSTQLSAVGFGFPNPNVPIPEFGMGRSSACGFQLKRNCCPIICVSMISKGYRWTT